VTDESRRITLEKNCPSITGISVLALAYGFCIVEEWENWAEMRQSRLRGRLLASGGAERRDGHGIILGEFVKLAGGPRAQIAFIVVGAEKDPEVGESYSRAFAELGVKETTVLQITQREEAGEEEALRAVKRATGVFFPGGDQLHVTALLGGTPMDKAIHDRYDAGVIIAGSSAGAAMMSDAIIIRGNAERNPILGGIEMGHGLEFLLGAILDTHFSQRGRYGRLISAVAQYPHVLGIGIDENTAIVVIDGILTVVGEGAVTIIDASASSYTNLPLIRMGDNLSLHDIRLHILADGYQYDLNKRRPITEEVISKKNGRTRKRVKSSRARQPKPRVRV
jgi:cyanophycinase